MNEYYVAWWNVENLFAPEDYPNRSDKLKRALGKELQGWTADVLNKKLAQLASIIRQMNDGRGPDLLGVCEVENRDVLDQLVAALDDLDRQYKVVHSDTKDARGIDVAFLYDSARFKIKANEVFNHFILRRNATRDLVQASFYTKPKGNRLVCIGNHWPSRSGGELESEPYRIGAAETLSYWHERILELFTAGAHEPSLLVMGDFNDEPFNRSLIEYALSERIERRVVSKRTQNPYLFNLMWSLMGRGVGTYYYEGLPNMLDQLLVNRAMLRPESALKVRPESVEILTFPEMVVSSGVNKGSPKRFGRPSAASSFDEPGFSDHLPIAVRVVEE